MAQLHYDKNGKYIGRSLSEEERRSEEQWRRDNWKPILAICFILFVGAYVGLFHILPWLVHFLK